MRGWHSSEGALEINSIVLTLEHAELVDHNQGAPANFSLENSSPQGDIVSRSRGVAEGGPEGKFPGCCW